MKKEHKTLPELLAPQSMSLTQMNEIAQQVKALQGSLETTVWNAVARSARLGLTPELLAVPVTRILGVLIAQAEFNKLGEGVRAQVLAAIDEIANQSLELLTGPEEVTQVTTVEGTNE